MPGFPSADAYYYVDDVSVVEDTTSGFDNNDNLNEIIISPNPCYNSVYLKNINKFSMVYLYAMDGKLIDQYIIPKNKNEIQIDLTPYSKNMYVLKFTNGKKEFSYSKLFKL
jgi:predicted carbohydrate-binding protein with CBM5 and CBM33 domain